MGQTLNYIWVGPPPGKMEGSVPAHDVIGPLNMVKQIDPQEACIVFWCLDQYMPYYQAKFSNTSIRVSSIEDCLVQMSGAEHKNNRCVEFATQLVVFKNKILNTENGRGSIRDLVTIKVVFAYFLLYVKGGYVLDTNVIPDANASKKMTFPDYGTFKIPRIYRGNAQSSSPHSLDIWMMYSPRNHEYAEYIFTRCIRRLNWVEGKKTSYPPASYPYMVREAVTKALLLKGETNFCDLSDRTDSIRGFWVAYVGGHSVSIPELSISKYFYNTHLDRGYYQMHIEAGMGKIDVLSQRFAEGGDVDSRIRCQEGSEFYENYTLLHSAIIEKQFDMVLFLIARGANVDIPFRTGKKDLLIEYSVEQLLYKNFSVEDVESVKRKKILLEESKATESIFTLFSTSSRSGAASTKKVVDAFENALPFT